MLAPRVQSRLKYLKCMQRKSDVDDLIKLKVNQHIIPIRTTRPELVPIVIVHDMSEFNKELIWDDLLAPNDVFSVTTCPCVPAITGVVVEVHWCFLFDIAICQLIRPDCRQRQQMLPPLMRLFLRLTNYLLLYYENARILEFFWNHNHRLKHMNRHLNPHEKQSLPIQEQSGKYYKRNLRQFIRKNIHSRISK